MKTGTKLALGAAAIAAIAAAASGGKGKKAEDGGEKDKKEEANQRMVDRFVASRSNPAFAAASSGMEMSADEISSFLLSDLFMVIEDALDDEQDYNQSASESERVYQIMKHLSRVLRELPRQDLDRVSAVLQRQIELMQDAWGDPGKRLSSKAPSIIKSWVADTIYLIGMGEPTLW